MNMSSDPRYNDERLSLGLRDKVSVKMFESILVKLKMTVL